MCVCGGELLTVTFQKFLTKSMIKECTQVVSRKWAKVVVRGSIAEIKVSFVCWDLLLLNEHMALTCTEHYVLHYT